LKLEPIIQMSNMMTGTWRRLGVHAFQGRITVEDITLLAAAGSRWHKQNPGKVVEMVIIFPSDARMNGDERARMAVVVKRFETVRTASATVVLAGGLEGAMHRSVLTGLQLITPPPHPTKVFGGVAEAVNWLEPHVRALCGHEVTLAAMQTAVEDLCRAFQVMRQAAPS
jgi:hypothetical protein